MRPINKVTAVVGRAVETGGGKQIDAVIAPAKTTREVRNRHDFKHSNAQLSESRQFTHGRLPCASGGKGPHVHLVKHLSLQKHTTPVLIMPLKGPGIDNLRRTMGTMGLKARGNIRIGLFTTIQPVTVERASTGLRHQS